VVDEREIAELIAGQLAPLGVNTEIAPNGPVALQMLRGSEYDAVTLDVLMPSMNGFEVLRAIRADPSLRSRPIVVVAVFSGGGAPRSCSPTAALPPRRESAGSGWRSCPSPRRPQQSMRRCAKSGYAERDVGPERDRADPGARAAARCAHRQGGGGRPEGASA